MALTDNLVSVWELKEASGNALDSFGSNTLTETSGTIAAASGKILGARDFEANDTEWFAAGSNTILRPGDADFTISAWVNVESLTTGRSIAGKYLTTGDQREYRLHAGSNGFRNTLRFSVSAAGTSTITTQDWSGTATTATWYFVVAWHDAANNQIGISVNNGSAETTAHSTGVFQGTGTFAIGAEDGSGGNAPYDGLIEQVAFWNRVLTSGERTTLYNSGAGLAYSSWGGGGSKNLFKPSLFRPALFRGNAA